MNMWTASVDITPTENLVLAGWPNRKHPCESHYSALEANILIQREGNLTVIVIGIDTLFCGNELREQFIEAIPKSQNALDTIELVLIATHTHYAPSLDPGKPTLGICDKAYLGDTIKILASKVDATVFVVRWGSTKMAVVKSAMEQLKSSGANFAGAFLSMVDLKRYSTYHYGDSGAYAGEMHSYYADASDKSADARDFAGKTPDAEAQLAYRNI